MCGIIGLFNDSNAAKILLAGMQTIQNRGADHYSIATENTKLDSKNFAGISKKVFPKTANVVGHCLHSVVSFCPQPFVGKGKLVSNTEIYNWKELTEHYKSKFKKIPQNDSETLFLLLENTKSKEWPKVLEELDGDFAFSYWRGHTVLLGRDIVGIKPVWYSHEKKRFAFASEAKALHAMGFAKATELNPRHFLFFDTKKNTLKFEKRPFFSITPTLEKSDEELTRELEKRLLSAVGKRIPEKEFGLLFSGGIDSVLLTAACLRFGKKPVLVHGAILDEHFLEPKDLKQAQNAAKKLELSLHVASASLKELPEILKTVCSTIETADPTKVSVGVPFFLATKKLLELKIKIAFSGQGSDGLFGGYLRQQQSQNPNRESLSYVIKAYENDQYRDDTISMQNQVELRVPYYDPIVVDLAVRLPFRFKQNPNQTKGLLRMLAKKWGLPEELYNQPKRAAQYGSNADKAIEKLAKEHGYRTKSDYLNTFFQTQNQRLGALVSGGKDGWYAALIQKSKHYTIDALITIQSQNKDSYMFHTPNVKLVKLQSKASEIPLVLQKTRGNKEIELKDLKKAIQTAQKRFSLDGIVNGALFSNYQRERIEKICDELGLKIYSPLWHKNQEHELKELVRKKFEVTFSSIACAGLDKTWLGKTLTERTILELQKLHEKFGINMAGEGGEYETLVLDCPLFKKKIVVQKSETKMQNECTGEWVVKKEKLIVT
ncbi:MAG: diphthine--ammonia ligase [Candidatus Micrarchaeota archaeon]